MRQSFEYTIKNYGDQKIIAEIGVENGLNTLEMLKHNLDYIVLVDPYTEYHDIPVDGKSIDDRFKNIVEQKMNMARMFLNIYPHFTRTVIMPMESERASMFFPDNFFDYVYIDGNHNYEFVKKDIECWFNKVKHNGVLSGHDYRGWYPGVTKAVDEFVKNNRNRMQFIEFSHPDSKDNDWLMHKI